MEIFKPCYDCCKLPSGFVIYQKTLITSFECSDFCGQSAGGKNRSDVVGAQGDCPYTVFLTFNKEFDPCVLYTKVVTTFDYGSVLIKNNQTDECEPLFEGGYAPTRTFTYSYDEDGECKRKIVTNAPLGFPGQTRSVSEEASDPITGCDYQYAEPEESYGISVSEFINPFAIEQSGTETLVTQIIHPPTQTCYLKYWMRIIFQGWEAYPSEIRQCGAEWEASGNVFYGDEYSYEWKGNKTPCINDPQKEQSSEENLIIGAVNWLFAPNRSGYFGVTGLAESKYSIVEGYEPKWPSERVSGADCLDDGYPKC